MKGTAHMKKIIKTITNPITSIKNRWIKLAALLAVSGILLTAGYFGTTWIIDYVENFMPLDKVPEEVKGRIITLRSLKEDYFLDFHNMYSSTVRKALEQTETTTLGHMIDYLHGEMEHDRKGEQLMYCIFDNKDNKLVGSLEIREKNSRDPGQFGCWINEQYWGGGRIQEAIKLITKTYFRLKTHEKSYIAHVRVWNKRSYHALKKAGFQEVGFFYENGKATRYLMEMRRK